MYPTNSNHLNLDRIIGNNGDNYSYNDIVKMLKARYPHQIQLADQIWLNEDMLIKLGTKQEEELKRIKG